MIRKQLDRQSQSAQPFLHLRVPGKRRVSLIAVDHFWTLKSTEYWVVSQVTFMCRRRSDYYDSDRELIGW